MSKKVITFNITPVPKPRMTQRDRWKKRPVVVRYHEYKDAIRASGLILDVYDCHITFVMPMPKSWPKYKKRQYDGLPHQQKPDIDNLLKAVLDSLFDDDSCVWDIRATKVWGREGKIKVRQ